MALMVSGNAIKQEQPKYFGTLTVAFDSSYPTGGEALDWESYMPAGAVLLGTLVDADGTYFFHYDKANKKLMAFVASTGAEVADTTDLSAVTGIVVTFVGV